MGPEVWDNLLRGVLNLQWQSLVMLLAGLLFGAPAGILAGILGAAGRILISATSNTPISYAAVLSLLAAGFFAAFLRRCLFDDKKPSAWYGLSIGFLMSICHSSSKLLGKSISSSQTMTKSYPVKEWPSSNRFNKKNFPAGDSCLKRV